MDSPETPQLTTTFTAASAPATIATSSSESPPAQDSSFKNFVNNLSPLKAVKSAPLPEIFSGLDSPPLVLSSPHLNENCESYLFERTHYAQSSDETFFINDVEGFIDKYLVDSEEVDIINFTDSLNVCLTQPHDVPESSSPCALIGMKKTSTQLDNVRAVVKVAGTDIRQPLSKKSEQNIEENLAPDVNGPVKSETKEPSTAWYNTECDLSANQTFKKQQNEDLCAQMQDACTIHHAGLDCTSQSLHKRSTIANSPGAYECNAKETLQGDSQPPPVAQTQRRINRRLQFEEATANVPQDNLHLPNLTSNVKATSPTMIEGIELSGVNVNSASENSALANPSRPDFGGNPPLEVSKPSGIGILHLNRVVKVVTNGHDPIASLSMQGVSSHLPENTNILSGNASSSAEYKGHESKAISTTATTKSYLAVKPLSISKPAEHRATPYETRNFDSDQSVDLEEIDNLSIQRKKKKRSLKNSGDDSKCCTCKKSKCLKLYCECFAAGIYCAESCACQGCFNNREHEETARETRRDIESRDPLAFAPRVIEDRNELPINDDDGRQLTPSLGRHKKGCNCKKSKCLKKYCECFQANIRCFSGCHCMGCKNVSGEHCVTGEIAGDGANVESLEGSLSENVTPQTQTFQYSAPGRCWINLSLIQPCCDSSSLRWPSSSVTPSTRSGETSKSLHQTSKGRGDDDTVEAEEIRPEISSAPINTVSVSCSNEKRVSPREVGSNSSVCLGGRRYVLKALPPFPPPTPSIEPRSSNDASGSDTPECNDTNS